MLLKSQTNSYYQKSKSIQKYQVIFTKKRKKKAKYNQKFQKEKNRNNHSKILQKKKQKIKKNIQLYQLQKGSLSLLICSLSQRKLKKLNAFEKIFDLYKLKNKRNIIYICIVCKEN